MVPELDLCCTDPTQHLRPAGYYLDNLDRDVSDLSVQSDTYIYNNIYLVYYLYFEVYIYSCSHPFATQLQGLLLCRGTTYQRYTVPLFETWLTWLKYSDQNRDQEARASLQSSIIIILHVGWRTYHAYSTAPTRVTFALRPHSYKSAAPLCGRCCQDGQFFFSFFFSHRLYSNQVYQVPFWGQKLRAIRVKFVPQAES